MGLRKWKVDLDSYFRTGDFILAEVDDVIEGILLEFPENEMLGSIDELLDKVLSELDRVEYKVRQDK